MFTQAPFNLIGGAADGIEPEPNTTRPLAMMLQIPFNEGIDLMGDAPVSGIEQDDTAIQLYGNRQGSFIAGESHWRGIPYDRYALWSDADRFETIPLIVAQRLKAVDTPPKHAGKVP